METICLWRIGSPDGRSDDLYDNYKDPNRLGDIVWDCAFPPISVAIRRDHIDVRLAYVHLF